MTNTHFWSYPVQFFLELEMFQAKVVEKIKTHILYSVTFFSESGALYEIMYKNMVELDRQQMKV